MICKIYKGIYRTCNQKMAKDYYQIFVFSEREAAIVTLFTKIWCRNALQQNSVLPSK